MQQARVQSWDTARWAPCSLLRGGEWPAGSNVHPSFSVFSSPFVPLVPCGIHQCTPRTIITTPVAQDLSKHRHSCSSASMSNDCHFCRLAPVHSPPPPLPLPLPRSPSKRGRQYNRHTRTSQAPPRGSSSLRGWVSLGWRWRRSTRTASGRSTTRQRRGRRGR